MGKAHWSLVDMCALSRKPPRPVKRAYTDSLLLVHWSVCQKLNHVSSVQSSHSVCTANVMQGLSKPHEP